MAVTWEVKIEVVNLVEKRAKVMATRTDDSTEPPDVWTYSLEGLVDTSVKTLAEIRAALINQIWANWEAYAEKQAQIATLLTGWESALESDLNAKEN